MIGIVCTDDISIVGHNLFNNFRKAITSIFSNIKDVRSCNDLAGIETLIIIDEHFYPNVEVWKKEDFLNVLNSNNIKTLIINFESIFNSPFNLAIDHQNFLQRINACIFIGQINEYYPTRYSIVEEFKSINVISPNVYITDRKLTYTEFLGILGSYKYVFNPLGIGQFINLRFYEALNLGCIVLQQYTDEMDAFYEELNHPSVIKFRTVDELVKKLENQSTEYIPYIETLEKYFEEINIVKILNNI